MKNLFIAVISILFSSVYSPSISQADFEAGNAAFGRGDFPAALRLYKDAADSGDAEAANKLGLMYFYGRDVEKDEMQGLYYVRRAAEGGHRLAQYILGGLHLMGQVVTRDYALAAHWLTMAADQGEARAQYHLGVIHANGYGVPVDHRQAVLWYRKAAVNGHAESQIQLGIYYLFGDGGLAKDRTAAMRWFAPAAAAGLPYAQHELALAHLGGDGAAKDIDRGLALLYQAAAGGSTAAEWQLAMLFSDGEMVPKNFGEAAKWYRKLADRGDESAIANLAWLHYNGGGGFERDFPKALALFQQSGDRGNAYSQYMAGSMYLHGTGIEQDYGRALKWLVRSADQGYAPAASTLGQMYENGLGVRQDLPKSERYYLTAIRNAEAAQERNDVEIAGYLNSLGYLHHHRGNFVAAETIFKRAIALFERRLDDDPAAYAFALIGLGSVYRDQGRLNDAEALYLRAADRLTRASEQEGLAVFGALAGLYEGQGRLEDSIQVYAEHVIPLWERHFADTPAYGYLLGNYARVLAKAGRLSESEAFYVRAFTLMGGSTAGYMSQTSRVLADYGKLRVDQGKYDEALRIFAKAFSLAEDMGLLRHPLALLAAVDYARAHEGSGDRAAALAVMRQAIGYYGQRAANIGTQLSAGGLAERRALKRVFLYQVALLGRGMDQTSSSNAALFEESFMTAQFAHSADVATAISAMATKFSSADPRLSGLIRERQDAMERWRRIDKLLTLQDPSARLRLMSPDGRDLAMQLGDIQDLVVRIDQDLGERFPDYADMLSPRPLSVAEVRRQLGTDEVLVAILSARDTTHVWAIGPDDDAYIRADIGGDELAEMVRHLRAALDPAGIEAAGARLPDFPLTLAWNLYRRLLLPAERILARAGHIFFVADGPLQSLPLSVLVTAPGEAERLALAGAGQGRMTTRGIEAEFAAVGGSQAKAPRGSRSYAGVAWLAERYAVTILPSVSSLGARSVTKPSKAVKPFLGIGDPALVDEANIATSDQDGRGTADIFLNLPRLPETADELRGLADFMGADRRSVLLGKQATEAAIKTMKLKDYRVIAFATHGLVAGEFSVMREPALVLSPPERISGSDDGLLTATEIMALDLDSDLIILSACNTAAADGTPGAERLSGLAKSFFYAGARSLLVSHWDVVSDAALMLTTGMFESRGAVKRREWAKALQTSMLKMLHDQSLPAAYTHPMFWAPFTVVGAQPSAS